MKVEQLPVYVYYFTLLLTSPVIEGARILAVLPIFARSHHRFFQPLLQTLARAGHVVVVYSPFPLDKPEPNYTHVLLENVATENENITQSIIDFMNMPHWQCLDIAMYVIDRHLQDFFESKKIQQLLLSEEQFDLVLIEAFAAQEYALIVGHVFKAPVIVLQAFTTHNVVNDVFGSSLSPSYIPDLCSPFSNNMTFYERVLNSIYMLRGLYYMYKQRYLPYLEYKFKQKYPEAPPILNMINNISLIFVNDHMYADYAQPRTPNIIPVAGIHIEKEKPLPKNIKKFMDEAKEGVILFSLGTYVPDELQPREYFDMYNNLFRQLEQRVLWKTRKENITGLPDNVMTIKWAPQRDILAHRHCVLFITHGGLLSQHETVHFGVPVVVIPQFSDQHRNGKFYEEQGIGIQVKTEQLSEANLLAAIRTVLGNPQYKSNVKRLSRIFKDRPMTPADTVVYWTEYVLKHGGTHLRPASTQLTWYQLALLDVIAAIVTILISVALVLYLVVRTLYSYCIRRRKGSEQRKGKVD